MTVTPLPARPGSLVGTDRLRDVAESCLDRPVRDMPAGAVLRPATTEDVPAPAGVVDRGSQGCRA